MRIVPDKSWIDIPRIQRWRDSRYKDGINAFIQYALADPRNLDSETIYCPCCWCKNLELVNKSDLATHLVSGFYEDYKYWTFHGEGCLEEMDLVAGTGTSDNWRVDDTQTMFADMLPIPDIDETEDVEDAEIAENAEDVNDPKNLARMMKLIEDNEKDLYEGCTEFTKLSFMLRLLRIKTLSGMADKYFDMLLKLLRKVIPKGEESIPKKYSKAKKIVSTLGLDYNKIDACPNDCILYYKDNKDLQECPTCGLSRWVQCINHSTQRRTETVLKQKKIPAKVLRHFPLIPRLQRLYMNKDTARSMRWHMEERIDDGKIRHPADAEAWKHVDRTFPWFANECRNVRLGLASDGFNPFGLMSSGWSTWPVVLMPYNLPPWLCIKQPYMLLSLLIPGKHAPENDIDIFLEPLIDELKQLWTEGVMTYDAYAKKSFRLSAIVLWTINDFPAYANLSGWSTKGTYACPVCGPEFKGLHLQYSRKFCYWFNRRWLDQKHRYRTKRWSKFFDGTVEKRDAPCSLTGDQIVHLLGNLPKVRFGKKRYSKEDLLGVRNLRPFKRVVKRKRLAQRANDENEAVKLPVGWTKFSIFFNYLTGKSLKYDTTWMSCT